MERGQLDNMRQSLFDEGFIGEAFLRLERLQTETDPNFIEETISTFYTIDSVRCLQNLEQALENIPVDFSVMNNHMVRFYGLGARRVKTKCMEFMEHCTAGNRDLEGCKMTFQQLKEELATIKGKLEAYFLLGRQVRAAEVAGGSNQVVDHQNGVLL